MRIQFCGAAREVTGSAHLITLDDGFTMLLDCGLFQGKSEKMEDFNTTWRFDPAAVDCVILSHAHIDHTGKLPKLVKDGFRNTIYATHATRSLCAIMLLDAAKIQEKDAEYFNKKQLKKKPRDREPFLNPLYSSEDVEETMKLFVTFGYDRWFEIHPNVKVMYKDAGHILGSAGIILEISENGRTFRVAFTGDVGRPDRPILRDPQPLPEADYVISESTYGDRDHEEKPAEIDHFLRIIHNTCVEKRGKLIIPAFSVGRTQEIVYILDQLESAGRLPKIPVYVDSPLSVNATQVFGSHPECFDNQLNEYLLTDKDPFGFNSLHYITDVQESIALNNSEDPCIIISSSGMANAGRVQHHIRNNVENPRNTILMVGYCAPGTLGAYLRDGAQVVKIFGEWKQVHAEVAVMDSFSAHADRHELAGFLSNQRASAKVVFLVHGEIEAQKAFRGLLLGQGFRDVVIPELGDAFEV